VACGDTVVFTISPADCNVIADVLVDAVSVGPVTSYVFNDVHAAHTIAASFASTNFALSSTHVDESCTGAADGSIDLTVTGGVPGFTYAWSNSATTQDISGLSAGIYTVTVTDADGCQASLSDTVEVQTRLITASAGANGSISPTGSVSVVCGQDEKFSITPDGGFTIDQLIVDGGGVTPTTSYTFTNVTTSHTISVTFKPVALAVETQIPLDFALGRVKPNPVTGSMSLRFGIPAESAVRLSILDLQGREVMVLASGAHPAGWHTASWSGSIARRPAPAGIYFVRLAANGRTLMQRFVITR
jgi:hypothetical protein